MILEKKSFAPLAASVIFALSSTNMFTPVTIAAEEVVRITWRLPREQLPRIRDELHLEDSTVTPDETSRDDTKGLPLIYIVAGFVALPTLVSAITTAARDVWCGGALVEETDDGLIVRCEPSFNIGTVVVRDKNGVNVHQSENAIDPSPLLEALGKLRL